MFWRCGRARWARRDALYILVREVSKYRWLEIEVDARQWFTMRAVAPAKGEGGVAQHVWMDAMSGEFAFTLT